MLLREQEEVQMNYEKQIWGVIWFNLKKVTFETNQGTKRKLLEEFQSKIHKSNLIELEEYNLI